MIIASINICMLHAQCFSGEYTAEGQWKLNNSMKSNFVNLLRLNQDIALRKGSNTDMLQVATLHMAKTADPICGDWQGFSNIEADNNVAAIAVLGYMHEWRHGHLFLGVRNVNEDFFTSDVTSLFTNSSCGIFPTIAASYPIANYPFSGLTVYFDVALAEGWVLRNSIYNGTGYNGWKHDDNPFLVRPKADGIFNMSQLEYEHRGAQYYAGVAVHTRQQQDADDNCPTSDNHSVAKTTCAWWVYGEQPLWTSADKCLKCMVQYSENTSRQNECYRYAEVGCAYSDDANQCGVSAQYARYRQGTERSVEATWRRQLTKAIAVQPSVQYITNDEGNYAVLTARLFYSF